MSELIVVAFNEKHRADEVMLDLLKKQQDHLTDLNDAVVVTKNSQGKLRVKPYFDLIEEIKGFKTEFWGAIITKLLIEKDEQLFQKLGIEADLYQKLDEKMIPDSSAIFVLANDIDTEKIVTEVNKYNGEILRTLIIGKDEAEIYQAINK